MHKIIVLIMSLFVMSSFANIFDYSKKDLKTYISIGGEARFMDVEDINKNVFGTREYFLRIPVYTAEKTLVDSLIQFAEPAALAGPQHKTFGDNNELWIPTGTVEFGVIHKNLSVGFDVSFGFNQVSKSPGGNYNLLSETVFIDTALTTYNYPVSLPKHDASFRTMDFNLTLGYLLLPEESFFNLAPRIKMGLQSVDVQYTANFAFAWIEDEEAPLAVQPFGIDEREYNSLGYTVSPELEASIKLSDYFQLSATLGRRFSFFNQFKITQGESVTYLKGDIDNSNHSYYAGAKFTVLIPSFNTKNRGKVNR